MLQTINIPEVGLIGIAFISYTENHIVENVNKKDTTNRNRCLIKGKLQTLYIKMALLAQVAMEVNKPEKTTEKNVDINIVFELA